MLIGHVRWSVVLGLVVACSADSARSPSTTPSPITAPRASIAALAPPSAITGSHGAAIATLAVTREGDAAITADVRGAIRVWPSLDGTREPFVVHAGRPSALAIAHDGDGFVIASIDAARGLELLQTHGDGRMRGRVKVRGEPVDDVVLLRGSVLALRADETIERLSASGERTAILAAEPGTRVVRLLVAGERALAIGERGTKKFVRWIEPDTTWGASISMLGFVANEIVAVSPDGAYLVTNQLGVARSISLSTGKQGPAICTDNASRTVALGFVEADVVACLVQDKLVWWSTSKKAPLGGAPRVVAANVLDGSIARGVLVSAQDRDLVLHRQTSSQQLGYHMRSSATMRFAPGGIMVTGGRQSVLVDSSLREGSTIDHPDEEELHAIGDGFAIALSLPEASSSDSWGDSHALSVFDLARARTHQKLGVRTSEVAFERSTGLLAAIDGAIVRLLRYDPEKHVFGAPIDVQAGSVVHRIALLDATLSRGIAALTVEERATGVIVGEIDASDLGGKRVTVRRTIRVAGELLAIDRAGRIYSYETRGKIHVQSRTHGTRDLAIDTLGLAPNQDGSRLAAIIGNEVSLYRADGTHVWTTSVRDVRRLGWLGDDLVAAFGDALVRFDLSTGALAARQCGWRFGLHEVKFSSSPETENVCDAD
ncbi:MAG: hypothetical protein ACKV2T_14755 [Kofleriaceae bacterium]